MYGVSDKVGAQWYAVPSEYHTYVKGALRYPRDVLGASSAKTSSAKILLSPVVNLRLLHYFLLSYCNFKFFVLLLSS
jgi:hypothetical protein